MEDKQLSTKPASAPRVKDRLAEIVGNMSSEGLLAFFGAILSEASEFKLDMQQRMSLADTVGADASSAQKWATAADFFKHFEPAEIVRRHPQESKDTLCSILSFIPVASAASNIVRQVPAETLSKVMGATSAVTPEHLMRMLAEHKAAEEAQRAARYMTDAPEEEGLRDLVIVCRDELLFNQLKMLVESEDDEGEDTVIGTKDGTVRILRWSEKKWLYRLASDSVSKKTLVIGDYKGVDYNDAFMLTKFEKYGVRYGWHKNCAFISADRASIKGREEYETFRGELGEMPVPESIKKSKKLKLDLKTGLKIALATPLIAKDLYDDSKAVERQMYFYGAVKFYYDALEEFLRA